MTRYKINLTRFIVLNKTNHILIWIAEYHELQLAYVSFFLVFDMKYISYFVHTETNSNFLPHMNTLCWLIQGKGKYRGD